MVTKRRKTLQPGEIIPITFDYVFTGIFNNQDNIEILEHFLSDYLNVPISSLHGNVILQSRELPIQNKKNKNVQIDLLVNINGKKINIELSNQSSVGVMERNIVYACNIHSGQLKYGDKDYSHIEKTLQIQLNNFRCNHKKIRKTYYLRDEGGKILTKKLQVDIVDMVLGKNLWYTSRNERLARWCKVFTASTNQELIMAIGGNLMEKNSNEKLIEEVDKYSCDEEIVALYMELPREELERNTYIFEAQQKGKKEGRLIGRKEGRQEGRKEGRKEGRTERTKEIARNLKKSGINIEIISKNTGLTKRGYNSQSK